MKDSECVEFLQWALPKLRLRWPGFRKVRGLVGKRTARRIKELGLNDVAGYRDYLQATPDEWFVLDELCRIPISRFYRDRGVFDLLGSEVLPASASDARARGRGEVLCWSAGCASGEEVYTLAILWKRHVSSAFPELTFRVTGTDSDRHMLERAQSARYSSSSLKDVPIAWLSTAFTRENSLFQVRPEYREGIEFVLQDLRREAPCGPFSLILCRHVAFTYFDDALQRATLERFIERLLPGGFLIAGKQEVLPSLPAELAEFRPRTGIYRLCGSP